MAGPLGLSRDRRRGDGRLRRGRRRTIDDGHGFIAVDEIRISDQPPPAAPHGTDTANCEHRPMLDLDAAIATSRAGQLAWPIGWHGASTDARAIEARIPEPTLALAIADGTGRTSTSTSGAVTRTWARSCPRRFLEVLGGSDSIATPTGERPARAGAADGRPGGQSRCAARAGQPALEASFRRGDRPDRPTTSARWARSPAIPELLDWLAGEFVARGWSIKAMHRLMVTSSTYRMSSVPRAAMPSGSTRRTPLAPHERPPAGGRGDPRRPARRLGPARADDVRAERARAPDQLHGRPRPARHSGPLDGDGRRSIYLERQAQFPQPDVSGLRLPVPFSTMGRRNVSNVPAQALTLLNDPLVISQARLWAERLMGESGRIRPRAARPALSRRPSAARRPIRKPALAWRSSTARAMPDAVARARMASRARRLGRSLPCADQYERVYLYRLNRAELVSGHRARRRHALPAICRTRR